MESKPKPSTESESVQANTFRVITKQEAQDPWRGSERPWGRECSPAASSWSGDGGGGETEAAAVVGVVVG
jgi:hypothetical protein